MMQFGLFYVISAFILLCSLMVVCSKNPVTSAIFLVTDLFFISALFATMNAHFIAAIQVLVYAGAIVVLFLFVIMLLNLKVEELKGPRMTAPEVGVLIFSVLGFVGVAAYLGNEGPTGVGQGQWADLAIEAAGGNTLVVALRMFTAYLWPFELASLLILLAIVASVVIAKKEKHQGAVAPSAGKATHGSR